MRFQAMNPLLPAGYDLIWTLALMVVLGLMIPALWQALRSRAHTGGQQLLWGLLIVIAPVLGSIAWFVLGRPKRSATDAVA